MLPLLTLAAASVSLDLEHPLLTFTRNPLLKHTVTTVDVVLLPNKEGERIYLFHRTVHDLKVVQTSWADTKSCPGAMWVLEQAINLPAPRIQIPGVKDTRSDGEQMLTIDGIGYSISAGARYGPYASSTIRYTSNWETPLAAWVDESLRRLEPCWRSMPPA